MTQSKNPLGLIVTTIIILLIGGTAFLVFRLLTGKQLTPTEAVKIIPENTLLTTYISTDAKTWAQLDKFGTTGLRQSVTERINNTRQQMLQESNIDYLQDVEPWLGGVMVAIIPPKSGESFSETQGGFVAIAGIKNKFKAMNFINKMKSSGKNTTTESQYKGVTVIEVKGEMDAFMTVDLIGDKVIISPSKEPLEAVIDTMQGNPSLAQQKETTEIINQASPDNTNILQVYIADYVGLLKQMGNEVTPEQLVGLSAVKSLIMGLGLNEQGIKLEAIAKLESSKINTELLQPFEAKVLSKMPGKIMVGWNGNNLNKVWDYVQAEVNKDIELRERFSQTREKFSQLLALDLDKDVFDWMDGEYGVGLVPAESSAIGTFPMGLVLMIQTTKPNVAENTISKIEAFAQDSGGIFPTKQNIAGTEVTQWQSFGRVFVSHGWQNNYFMLSAGLPFETIANVSEDNSLKGSERFKTITKDFPPANSGYFYIDVQKVLETMNNINPEQIQQMPPETREALNSIEGLVTTTTLINDTTSKLEVLLALKPAQKQ